MTQAHLALAAGVSESTVRRVEKGQAIAAESMRSICAVLQLETKSVRRGRSAADRKRDAERRRLNPWDGGPIVFKGLDGKMWPFKPRSDSQHTFVDLVVGPPGVGKSTLVNAASLATCGISPCTGAGEPPEELPFITTIGYGDDGWLRTLKARLPAHRHHEVATVLMADDGSMAVNPFDTPLGFRRPTLSQWRGLVSFLELLWEPACRPDGMVEADALKEIAGECVSYVYDRLSDCRYASGEPRRYARGLEPMVDASIESHGLAIEAGRSSWWEIVDALSDRKDYPVASLAQRHAVPVIADIMHALTQIGLLDDTAQSLRLVTAEAVHEHLILAGPTRAVETCGARIISVDLSRVSPRGGAKADRMTALMTLLARLAWGEHLFLSREDLGREFDICNPSVSLRYVDPHYPFAEKLAKVPKRLVYDDLHRTGRPEAIRTMLTRDLEKGRLRDVHVSLVSQLESDFAKDHVEMATAVWLFITGEEGRRRLVERAVRHLDLSTDVKDVPHVKARFLLKTRSLDGEFTLTNMPLAASA